MMFNSSRLPWCVSFIHKWKNGILLKQLCLLQVVVVPLNLSPPPIPPGSILVQFDGAPKTFVGGRGWNFFWFYRGKWCLLRLWEV
ncbi:unnamed protein product, partial [Linum tenue]